ncbi:MAG: hypothetical protein KF754_08705 [Planctomycetes bacterium]|nr:hypothetical protein [Planctomycetota bacterium]
MTDVSAEQFYAFTHAVYREVAYHLQPPSERAQHHALAADILEQAFAKELPRVARELAEHARHAADAGDADHWHHREAGFLKLALKNTRGRELQLAGVQCATRLLELGVLEPREELDVRGTLADLLRDIGRHQQRMQCLRDCLALAEKLGLSSNRVNLLCDMAIAESMAGNSQEAEQLYRQAEAESTGATPETLASILQARGTLLDLAGDIAGAESSLRRAVVLLEQCGRYALATAVKGNVANLLGSAGRRREALDIYAGMQGVVEASRNDRQRSVLYSNIGKQWLELGDAATAEGWLQRALDIQRGLGIGRSEAFSLANLSEAWRQLGKLAQAEDAVLRALEIAAEYGQPIYTAAYLATHAGLLLLTGRETEAQQRLEESRAQFESGAGIRFVPEYCDIWRLRVAASVACAGSAVSRRTSGITAEPPQPRWVKAAALVLSSMRQALKSQAAGGELAARVAHGAAVVHELELALAEKRPALLFRGHLPTELPPALRAALLEDMRQRHPAQHSFLARHHPALLAALESGVAPAKQA